MFNRLFFMLWLTLLPASLGVTVVLGQSTELLIVKREVKVRASSTMHASNAHPAQTYLRNGSTPL